MNTELDSITSRIDPPSVGDEVQRRKSLEVLVEAFFRAHPQEWIDSSELMKIGGMMAWRTRISDARKVFVAEGGRLENRQRRTMRDFPDKPFRRCVGPAISEYRYLPYQPLGPEASTERPREGYLFLLR